MATIKLANVSSFNPRPLAGDDTYDPISLGFVDTVSIHVPLRGTTRYRAGVVWKYSCFNPRPLAGDDTDLDLRINSPFKVSIHVPLRGTTPI